MLMMVLMEEVESMCWQWIMGAKCCTCGIIHLVKKAFGELWKNKIFLCSVLVIKSE